MLEFELEPLREPLRVGSQQYVICGISTEDANKWRNAQLRATSMSGTPGQADFRITRAEGFADTEAELVSYCVYRPEVNGEVPLDKEGQPDRRHRVSIATVRAWPPHVTKAVFDRCVELNRLNEEMSEEALEKQIQSLQKLLEAKRRGN